MKILKYKRNMLAATALAFAPALSTAATLSNVGNAWPGSPALETVTNTDTNNGRALKANRGEFVQSFTTTTAFQIDKIYIEVRGLNNNVDFELRIFEMADVTTNTAGTVVLAPITMNTGSTVPGPSADNFVLEFDLVGAEQITLAANQGYGIGLSSAEADADQSIFTWNETTSNAYTDGRAFGDQAGVSTDRTLAFTAVPEPSAALLGALGLLALLRRRRA